MRKIVDVDKAKLEEIIKEIIEIPEIKRAKIFVENFFNSLGGQTLEQAYLNYLRDLEMYSFTNKAIRDNTTYLCYVFSKITHASIEELLKIEGMYRAPPKIIPLDRDALRRYLENDEKGDEEL